MSPGRLVLRDTPSGTTEIVAVELYGQQFIADERRPAVHLQSIRLISGRLLDTKDEVEDALAGTMSQGGARADGTRRIPFQREIADGYRIGTGCLWQIMFMGERPITQRIIPTLMFVGGCVWESGRGHQLLCTSVFQQFAQVGDLDPLWERPGAGSRKARLCTRRLPWMGQEFAAHGQRAYQHEFSFNEAISFVVNCTIARRN